MITLLDIELYFNNGRGNRNLYLRYFEKQSDIVLRLANQDIKAL